MKRKLKKKWFNRGFKHDPSKELKLRRYLGAYLKGVLAAQDATGADTKPKKPDGG